MSDWEEMMIFAEKLRMLRKKMGMTQEQLAEKIGVSRQAITKWETNAGIPDIENMISLSKLFDISLDELLVNQIEKREKQDYVFESETLYDIGELKHYDIKLGLANKIIFTGYEEEKIRVRLASNAISSLKSDFKIKVSDIKKRIDVDIRKMTALSDTAIKEELDIYIFLPIKYVGKVECDIIANTIELHHLKCESIELDCKTSNLLIDQVMGKVEINSNLDMNIECTSLNGRIDINQVNAISRIQLPKATAFSASKKGLKTRIYYERNHERVEAFEQDGCAHIIELNGFNSELIISEAEA